MIYTLEQLHKLILPMLESAGAKQPEALTDAIVRVIKEDREAHAKPSNTEMAADND